MFDWDEVDGEPATVTSAPYDVLTAEDVARLKKLSAHNVTHVTLPDPVPGKEPETKYGAAAKTLRRWRKEGIIHQRKDAGYFVYDEVHTVAGERRSVRGLVCLLRLDPTYTEVHPHERTHKGPIADRFDLLRATGTDLEPIQFLYKDEESQVNALLDEAVDDREPLVDFADAAGTQHRLWAIDDLDSIERLTALFGTRDAYIADGHHRYATACAYAAERREDESPEGEGPQDYDFKLSVFVNRDDPGLAVYPTHRLLEGLKDPAAARTLLQEHFRAEPVTVSGAVSDRAKELVRLTEDVDRDSQYRFVFYWGDGDASVVTLGRDDVPLPGVESMSEAWRRLDVAVLHHGVLPVAFGIDHDNAGDHLRYTRIANEAVEGVDRGRHQCAVFMNATPLGAVTEIADAGEHMPQKSTYFQPKLQSGLVFSGLK